MNFKTWIGTTGYQEKFSVSDSIKINIIHGPVRMLLEQWANIQNKKLLWKINLIIY